MGLDTLCLTCQAIFHRDLASCCPGLLEIKTGLTYLTFQHHCEIGEFRKAALGDCLICLRNWRHTDDRSSRTISHILSSTDPIDFRMEYAIRSWNFRDRAENAYSQPPFWLQMEWWINGTRFDLFYAVLSRDDPQLIQYQEIAEIDSSTSSTQSLTLAREWIEQCIQCHDKCGKGIVERNFVPKRLLDIGDPGDTTWRLTYRSSSTRYITLSYRWGDAQSLKLTSSISANFCEGLPNSRLPRLFRDVISVAHRFSVRYLWIDSLCIEQDSIEDWRQESRQMREIYSHSYFTIAAGACPNPDHSLFQTRKIEDIRSGLVQAQWASLHHPVPKFLTILERDAWDHQRMQSPLSSRGWALQERLLAPRVLHFAKSQLLWECDTTRLCEAYPRGAPRFYVEPFGRRERLRSWFQPANMKQQAMSFALHSAWKHLVELYSRCMLTKASDKLIAFAGLTDLFQRVSQDTCLVGLWRPTFLDNLCWRVSWYEGTIAKPNVHRAPSWSWASVDGPIFIPTLSESRTYHYPTGLLHVQVNTEDSNAVEGLSGHVTVRGPAVAMLYEDLNTWSQQAHSQRRVYEDLKIYIDLDDSQHAFGKSDIFFLLLIRFSMSNVPEQVNQRPDDRIVAPDGLVLQRREGEDGTFLRSGSFSATRWTKKDLEKFGVHLNQVEKLTFDEGIQPSTFKIY